MILIVQSKSMARQPKINGVDLSIAVWDDKKIRFSKISQNLMPLFFFFLGQKYKVFAHTDGTFH